MGDRATRERTPSFRVAMSWFPLELLSVQEQHSRIS